MLGFVGVISNDVDYDSLKIEYKSLGKLVKGKKQYDNALVERYTNPKFLEDKVFYEDQSALVLIDGFVLNFKELINKYIAPDYFNTVKKMYYENGDDFFKEFRGDFSGLLYDKPKEKWLIFTNHTGSKPVFYYKDGDVFVCASELQLVTQILRKLGCRYSLDSIGCYFLLTFGFMLEDYTLIEEVKRLKPGNYIKIEDKKAQVDVYNVFNNDVLVNSPLGEIIENLETLFKKSVAMEYEKDLEYGYKHIATLSGGLDSRMSVMTARELGYDNILNITFSQSNYWDERIAKKVALDLGNEFLFYALDNGNFLKNTIRDSVIANGGLVLYSGSAHGLSMFKKINFGPFGMVHTGQIGDAVLGSFLSKPRREKPQPSSGAYSSYLLGKISGVLDNILQNYESEEIFKFYNRAFNGAINGNWIANQFTEACSAFLDVDFLRYALSIPPSLKYKEQIYHEWILAKRPAAAKYVWEQTKAKLTANKLFVEAKVFLRRARFKLLGKSSASYSMNPFQYWYNTNEQLRLFANNYFQQNIYLLDEYPELKSDSTRLFNERSFIEKTQVMSLLEAIKLHFH